ncbi:MAG TPA: M1 family metallopeptidase [bacterium]|jgi:leukotriene A-4 hydrolase/aminopeptidase
MPRKDPHSVWDPASAAIKHIAFDLTVDFEKHTLAGTADYQFTAPLGRSLELDTRNLQIQSVTAPDGRALAFKIGKEDVLGSALTIDGTEGLERLRITYATSPDAAALQWLKPSQTAGGKHPFMFSQCQAILARTVFPCQDTPSVRFTYEATMRVPHGLSAVMAADMLGSANNNGSAIYRFAMRHPIPSYLFALAAGNIVPEKIGARSRVYAEPETVKGAAWEFGEVDRMIEGAEQLYGTYIWDQFNLLVMPPSFPYGGMENPTLTFLTPTLIAGDRSLVSVVAHELAHSWTGNLVTNATWEDFWLNEGWTVYAERRIVERLYGKELANLQAVNGRYDLMVAFKNFGLNSPYTKLKTDLAGIDPDEVFSSVPYEKGFLLLVAIERAVGREVFDPFILSYINDFRFQSATTEEFIDYLQKKLPGVDTKVDLRRWIYQPNLPDSTPTFESTLIDDVQQVRKQWDAGARDLKGVISKWNVDQKTLFLAGFEQPVTESDCAALEQIFDIGTTKNSEILLPWLCIAAMCSYAKAYPMIRDFLGSVGRGKYLKPLYRALHENPATRSLARSIFEDFKDRYHSVARGAVQRILAA